MRRIAYCFVVIIFPVALEAFADSSVNLLDIRYFHAETDLVIDRFQKEASIDFSSLNAEKYNWDMMDYKRDVKAVDEKNESRRSRLQWGRFRLMFSRSQDGRSGGVTPRTMEKGDDIQKMIKSLPSQFRDESYRENLETIGRIFAPQFDLGLEF